MDALTLIGHGICLTIGFIFGVFTTYVGILIIERKNED